MSASGVGTGAEHAAGPGFNHQEIKSGHSGAAGVGRPRLKEARPLATPQGSVQQLPGGGLCRGSQEGQVRGQESREGGGKKGEPVFTASSKLSRLAFLDPSV